MVDLWVPNFDPYPVAAPPSPAASHRCKEPTSPKGDASAGGLPVESYVKRHQFTYIYIYIYICICMIMHVYTIKLKQNIKNNLENKKKEKLFYFFKKKMLLFIYLFIVCLKLFLLDALQLGALLDS